MKKDKIKEIQVMIENGTLYPGIVEKTPLYGKKIPIATKSDGAYIYEALNKKTFVKQEGSDVVVAFTDECLVEISEKTMNEVVETFEKYTEHLKKSIRDLGVGVEKVAELISLYESAYSNYLTTPRFEKLRKDVIAFLKEIYETGNEETKIRMKKGYEQFFEESRQSIPRGALKFPGIKIRVKKDGSKIPDDAPSKWIIKIEEEKESLRNEFIFKALDEGLWDYQFLFENGIISGLGGYDVNSFVRESVKLTPEEKVNAFIVSGVVDSREELLEYYMKNNKKFFVEIANIEEIVDALVNGNVSIKDINKRLKIQEIKDLSPEKLESVLSFQGLPKNLDFLNFVQNKKTNRQEKYISKKLFNSLSREQILQLVYSDKIVYDNPLESEDYIDMYGKLKIEDYEQLIAVRKINDEDVIKLTKFEAIEQLDKDEYEKMLVFVKSFYSLDKLNEMIKNSKMSKGFVSLFNKNFLGKLNDKDKYEYINNLYSDILRQENSEENLISLLSLGFDLPVSSDMGVSKDTILEMYLEDKIDEMFIISMYKKGYTSIDSLKELLSEEQFLEEYRKGNLSSSVLNYVSDRQNIIRQELEAKKITIEDVVLLYSEKEGINIEELKYILENEALENIELSEYIPDSIDKSKIEGLFENYFISHDELTSLVLRGIISKEAANLYAAKMNTHEIFESIFDGTNSAILIRDTEHGESKVPGPKIHSNTRAGQIKNDPDIVYMLLDEIGFDSRELVLCGENNSLDGYKVRASDKYGLMVFSNLEKAGNASYVMSLQQGLFFLNRLIRKSRLEVEENKVAETTIDGVVSTATKQELRETEHVKVRNASKWLGRNLVDSMKKISDSFAKDYQNEKQYKEKIDEVIEAIRDDYDERRK